MNWTTERDPAAPAAWHSFPRTTAPSSRTPCLKSPSRSGCRQSALPPPAPPLQSCDVSSSPPFLLRDPSCLLLFRSLPSAPFGSIASHLARSFSSPGLRHLNYCPYGRVASCRSNYLGQMPVQASDANTETVFATGIAGTSWNGTRIHFYPPTIRRISPPLCCLYSCRSSPAGCPRHGVCARVLGFLLLLCGCPRFDFLPGSWVSLAVGYRLIAINSLSQSSHLFSSCCGLLTVG